MAVLGRTLEHLGVQMYKRRDTAIAELVANSWDANANHVWVDLPKESHYENSTSEIIIEDDGEGMTSDEVDDQYLVVGRNRRRESGEASPQGAAPSRRVMGRKGIGKLAGFGIAKEIEITTWRDGYAARLTLDIAKLKLDDKSMLEIDIPGEEEIPIPTDVRCPDHGTRLVLRNLKHKTAPNIEQLNESLSRRFSRTVRGLMTIEVCGDAVVEPIVEWEFHVPSDGSMQEAELDDGNVVRYRYSFSKTPLRQAGMRGFTILANGKTAQAPPFYFDVEATATAQHGTKNLSGTIEADFIDFGTDDETDVISTDRQEIDWEAEETIALHDWGAKLTRQALVEFRDFRQSKTKERVLADEGLRNRIERLDKTSQDQINKILGTIGLLDADSDTELILVSSLISAFEFRHFHDLIDEIEAAEDNPEQLQLLLMSISNWRVLESRAILEVIKGRISIIDKFHEMIVNGAPETAHRIGDENLHDLLADFPWLLHPEWQVLSEEKTISKQLVEWHRKDVADSLTEEEARQRYDFLALGDGNKLLVIEIKRPNYAPNMIDLQRLVTYQSNLARAEKREIEPIFISSNNFDEADYIIKQQPVEMFSWADIHARTKAYYEHYRALLEGESNHPDFHSKESELARARSVLDQGAFRGVALRASGIGEQDPILARLPNKSDDTGTSSNNA
jgi:hypothetical protein